MVLVLFNKSVEYLNRHMDYDTRQEFKSNLYEQFAQMGKAFGNARRLEIIDLLSQKAHTVEDLAGKMGLSIASVSQHLQVLKSSKVVEVTREGTYAWYRLADERVFGIWDMMRSLAQERNAEIEQLMKLYFNDRFSLEAIDTAELLRRMEKDCITIIDARPLDEYQAGHIPNALSITADTLKDFLDLLPADCEVVAYCRASYCLFSDEVALMLRERGFNVSVYEEGFPQWRANGLPIAKSTGQLG